MWVRCKKKKKKTQKDDSRPSYPAGLGVEGWVSQYLDCKLGIVEKLRVALEVSGGSSSLSGSLMSTPINDRAHQA